MPRDVLNKAMQISSFITGRCVVSLTITALVAGCGSPTSMTTSTITGTVRGQEFSPGDAVSAISSQSMGPSTSAEVILSSRPGLCEWAKALEATSDIRYLTISFHVYDKATDTSAAPEEPGKFTILSPAIGMPADGHVATARYSENDSNCELADQANAVAGTVSLDSVKDGVFVGTADLDLDTGEHIVVAFRPTACPELPPLTAETVTSCN